MPLSLSPTAVVLLARGIYSEQSHQDPRETVILPPAPTDHLVHIRASSNNTVVTVTTAEGDAINWASAGSVGFKGAKRSTTFAAQTAGAQAGQKAAEKGISAVRVIVRGMGAGRAAALKGLQASGLKFISVTDRTPVSAKFILSLLPLLFLCFFWPSSIDPVVL